MREQQGVIERQPAEINRLNGKIAELRDERNSMLKHLGVGPETWPDLTEKQVREMDRSGFTLDEVLHELQPDSRR